ncbi:MAG TPA: sulfur carrier protein ThiS, partial [Blastocatellia bacterium]|nr:sulfur carrier protein ThiS [Blastocatellia bacterium]
MTGEESSRDPYQARRIDVKRYSLGPVSVSGFERKRLTILVNGEERVVADGLTVAGLLQTLRLKPERLAVELNRKIVRRAEWGSTSLSDGDKVEVVHFVGGGQNSIMSDNLVIAGREFKSRLILGTGKYESFELMERALDASGTDMVTVAVRRVNLTDRSKESLLDHIDLKKYHLLPNTAGCYTAEEAIRTAMLAREALDTPWVKLEVLGDERTLFPDNEGLLQATRELVREGFIVLPYLNDDLIVARRLVDAGAAAIMPLAAPIGSGLGIQNFTTLRIMREQITEVPLIVDAGVGTASDATLAMELGVEGILMNTGVAGAQDPVMMAEAMNCAVRAGRLAFL